MRLALFSPWPPAASGIADYARDLVGGLAQTHEIEVFVADRAQRLFTAPRGVSLRDAHDFPWAQVRTTYDLVVYQLGNAAWHDFMWPYLFRYPGLVVLHDGHLHHARASTLLRRNRAADYEAELHFNHPDLPAETALPAIQGFDGPLYYLWPMLRTVMLSARYVAVHNRALADDLTREFPGTSVATVTMGVPPVTASDAEIAGVRRRHGIAPDAVVLGAFGGVTPEKRLGPLLAAAAIARRYQPTLRVLLVGPSHSHYDAMADARAAGIAEIVTTTGFVAEDELPAYLKACDIISCLRFPTARETSASWLRALAAGRPTLVTDLAQQVEVPTLDPQSWTVLRAGPSADPASAVAVNIPPLDEMHALTVALKRLVTDAPLRDALGARALEFWRARHTVAAMVRDWERVLSAAATKPAPAVSLPPHLRPDGLEHARRIATSLGIALPDELA